ncbi:LptF/LptG family permease [Reinekea forsetii]|nr:LptF/LptG family permease [Reinekea forsetii]
MTQHLLFRFLFRKALVTTLIVFGSLAGLLLILGIADETSRRVTGNYTAVDALQYKLFTLPLELYEFAPLLIALAALITFASLNKNSELVIFKQMTSSAAKLILKLYLPIIAISAPLFWLGEWIAPTWSNNATVTRAELRGRALPTQEQQWFKSGDYIIATNLIDHKNGSLISPSIFSFSNQGIASVTQATRANADNNAWQLTDATIDLVNFGAQRNTYFKEQIPFETPNLTPEVVKQIGGNTDALSLPQLSKRVYFSQQEDTLNNSDALEWWQRVLFPLEILLMLNLALIFSFTSFRQKTVGDVVFKGLATALALTTLLDVLMGVLAIAGLPIFVAASLPLALGLVVTQFISVKRL